MKLGWIISTEYKMFFLQSYIYLNKSSVNLFYSYFFPDLLFYLRMKTSTNAYILLMTFCNGVALSIQSSGIYLLMELNRSIEMEDIKYTQWVNTDQIG